MNVLLLIDTMTLGGAEQQVVTDANLLVQHGFKVTLACFQDGPMKSRLFSEVGFVCFNEPSWFKRFLALRNFCKEHKVELIQAHMWQANQIGALAGWSLRIPVIATEHGMELWRSPKHIWSARLTYRMVRHIYAVCEATRSVRIHREGVSSDRISIMYNSFDSLHVSGTKKNDLRQSFAIKDQAPVIGFIGRLHPVKRLDLLVEIAERVLIVHPEAIFLLVGDGAERKNIEGLIAQKGLTANFQMAGYQTNIADFLSLMDVLVLTSEREALSMAILEAAASGVPAVAFAVGGNPEAIENDVTGYVVPFGDTEQFAARLIELLSNNEHCSQMSAQARERAYSLFSPEIRLLLLVEAYRAAGVNKLL